MNYRKFIINVILSIVALYFIGILVMVIYAILVLN